MITDVFGMYALSFDNGIVMDRNNGIARLLKPYWDAFGIEDHSLTRVNSKLPGKSH